jgi:hypothetical protein
MFFGELTVQTVRTKVPSVDRRRRFRRLWAFVQQASTLAWLWSIGGGTVFAVFIRQVTSLPLGWLFVFGLGMSCLIMAAIGTFTRLGRPSTEAAAPAPSGSGFDPSKWAVTWGGSFVRSDYEAGHEWLDSAKRILLWLRPPTDEPIDPAVRCQVNTAYGILVTSPTVGQVGGPLAPGAGRRNGVPNADYLIEYPTAFGVSARMSDGMFEVMWLSGNVSIRGDSFVISDGLATS